MIAEANRCSYPQVSCLRQSNKESGDSMQVEASFLTTVDNPYDPADDFDNWYQFDMSKGYSSCCYLSRIAETNDSMSDEEQLHEIDRAIDEIIRYDFMNIYRKIKKTVEI